MSERYEYTLCKRKYPLSHLTLRKVFFIRKIQIKTTRRSKYFY